VITLVGDTISAVGRLIPAIGCLISLGAFPARLVSSHQSLPVGATMSVSNVSEGYWGPSPPTFQMGRAGALRARCPPRITARLACSPRQPSSEASQNSSMPPMTITPNWMPIPSVIASPSRHRSVVGASLHRFGAGCTRP
jgi:hypothetical protein